MEGDVALAYVASDEYLELQVAVRPGFKPTGWIVVGHMACADKMELLKAASVILKKNALQYPRRPQSEISLELMFYNMTVY